MTYTIERTGTFMTWFSTLDKSIANRILARLDRVSNGNFGDHKIFGDVVELRFTFGDGIRLYFTIRKNTIVLLLNGGNKSSQDEDFKKARAMIDLLEG